MSTFLELPTEILHAIVLELGNGSHRKPLRSTCKGLSAVVEPILFSEIVLKTDRSGLVRWSISFCEALCKSEDAVGKALATYVRTLRVKYPFYDNDASQEILDAWRDIFCTALSKLINLKSFSLEMSWNGQGWMYDQVFEVISKLPSLSEFILAGELPGYPGAVRLGCLHNLRTLLIDARSYLDDDGFEENILGPLTTAITNSPDLQTLKILAPYPGSKSPSFIDLFKSVRDTKRTPALKIKYLTVQNLTMEVPPVIIPHLQCLSSLEVRSLRYTDIGNFWNALGTANVSLESLIVDCDQDRTLFDYISQFHSRLQVLKLSGAARSLMRTLQESDELADLFFGSVLPRFAESLRVLKIRPSYEGRWCIGLHNLETLSSCTNLESLSLCLNGSEIVDVVGNVLDRAHSLPRLKYLYLGATPARSHRNPMWVVGSSGYCERMGKALQKTVENLEPNEAHVGTGLCILPFSYTVCRTQDGSLRYEVKEEKGR